MFGRRLSIALCAIAVSMLQSGCGEDDPQPTTDSRAVGAGAYRGVLSGAESGTLEISIGTGTIAAVYRVLQASPSSMSAAGTLMSQHGTFSLSGTFNPQTGAFTLTGGGYSFSGSVSSGAIVGNYTGPRGSGGFVLMPTSAADAGSGRVELFCGTAASGSSAQKSLNVSAIHGGVATAVGDGFTWTGTWGADNEIRVSGPDGSAIGSLTAMSGAGTWTRNGSTGTWSLAPCTEIVRPIPDSGTVPDSGQAGSSGVGGIGASGGAAGTGGASGVPDDAGAVGAGGTGDASAGGVGGWVGAGGVEIGAGGWVGAGGVNVGGGGGGGSLGSGGIGAGGSMGSGGASGAAGGAAGAPSDAGADVAVPSDSGGDGGGAAGSGGGGAGAGGGGSIGDGGASDPDAGGSAGTVDAGTDDDSGGFNGVFGTATIHSYAIGSTSPANQTLVAWRDGAGPWVALSPVSLGVYTFTPTAGTYAVAAVCSNSVSTPTDTTVQVFEKASSTTSFDVSASTACASRPTPSTVPVVINVANVPSGVRWYVLAPQGEYATAAVTTTSQNLAVQPGSGPWLALVSRSESTPPVMLVRNPVTVDQSTGSLLFDFADQSAFVPIPTDVTWANLSVSDAGLYNSAPNVTYGLNSLVTSQAINVAKFSGTPMIGPSEVRPYGVIPSNIRLQFPNDWYQANLNVSTTGMSKTTFVRTHATIPSTISAPDDLGAVSSFTSGSTPYLQPGLHVAAWSGATSYAGTWSCSPDKGHSWQWSVAVDTNSRSEAPQYDLAVPPDLSTISGWSNAWELPPSGSIGTTLLAESVSSITPTTTTTKRVSVSVDYARP